MEWNYRISPTQRPPLFAGSARGSNTYVGLLNEKVHGGAVRIKTDSPRIEKRLFDQAHKLAGKLAKAKGQRRDQLLQQDYAIFIFEGETDSLQEIWAEVAKEVVTLQEEYESVKAEASRSKEETEALLEQMATLSCACEVRPNRGESTRMYQKGKPEENLMSSGTRCFIVWRHLWTHSRIRPSPES